MIIEVDIDEFNRLAQNHPVIKDRSGNDYVVFEGFLCIKVVTAKNVADGKS